MHTDLEQYLNGEMTPEERAEFERRLKNEPGLAADLEEQKVFLEHLRTQMMREKIAHALAEPPAPNPWKKRASIAGVLLLLITAAFWFFRKKDPAPPDTFSVDPPTKIRQAPAYSDSLPQPSEEEPQTPATGGNKPGRPIAGIPAPQPTPGASGVRGQSPETSDWNRLVESVWTTRFDPPPGAWNQRYAPVAELLKAKQFPDAYVQLQLLESLAPPNDTLSFLKGYCLLELREGAAALRYFEQLPEGTIWREETAWYKTLAWLLNGDRTRALKSAKDIYANREHRFRSEAKALIDALD